MIPFDFEYDRPSSVREALERYRRWQAQGKDPMYFSGGTELITWARQNSIRPGAVIDLKAIPDCNAFDYEGDRLIIGSNVALSVLSAKNLFPLLGRTAQGVADQTARNQITLGGNCCGRIHYRETVLPLLLSNCRVVLAGLGGEREVDVQEAFHRQMMLENGEFVVQFRVGREYASLPFYYRKRRQIGNVGYPLVTMAALKKDGEVRAAFSGVCAYPFRSAEMERELNDPSAPLERRAELAVARLPAPLLADAEGTPAYREYLLKLTIIEAMRELEGR